MIWVTSSKNFQSVSATFSILDVNTAYSKIVSNMKRDDESAGESDVDIIEKCIGVLGRWHMWIFTIVSLSKLPSEWHLLGIIFLAPPIDSYCVDNSTDKCAANCTAVKYDTSVFTSTITTEWHLICEDQYLTKLTQSMTMLGMMAGNIIFGHLSDRYGRHPILVIGIVIQSISGTIAAFAPCFTLFVVMKFIAAMATGGIVIISTVFVIEMLGIKWRTVLGTLCHIPISLGYMLMVPISYYLRDWRAFELAISAPPIVLVVYYWILPESPRWQLAVGQKENAIKTLKSIANHNRLSTEKIETQVDTYVEQNRTQAKIEHKENLLDLFKSRSMCIYTLSIWFNWFVCGFCFYGLSQYVGNLSGNIFINVFFSGLSQIPSILFTCWSTEKWGRKNTLIFANIAAAITLVGLGLVEDNTGYIKTGLVTLCTFFTVLAFCTVYIYSIELFPTIFRNIGVGSSSMCARVGSIMAPFVATLSTTQKWVPPVVFGVTSVLGALLCLKLPETRGCKLPESIEDVEHFGRGKIKAQDTT